MSKKKKKRRPRRPPLTARDRHHICWTRASWDKGYARAIRDAFVRPVPVVYHRELHTKLRCVPVPDETLLRSAWALYQKDSDEIDSYGVCRAAAWLYVNIPDPEFRAAMQYQIDFFTTRLHRSG